MGAKFGKCPKCPAGSPPKRLYGGVCAYHLSHPTADNSKDTRQKQAKGAHEAELLKVFFREQTAKVPARCENCDQPIIVTAAWPKSAAVCHIIPKKHFKSVMIHPLNRWFGCINCHGDYDNKGWSFAITMPIWPVCVERFAEFMMLIKDTELKYLPDALLNILQINPPQ